MRRLALFAVTTLTLLPLGARPGPAQVMDLLTAPKTLVDRAIEARSAKDILIDNRIVGDVNRIMVELGTIKASTEIYEQRLLITGIFNDKPTYDKFLGKVKEVKGVKKLYWHVVYMPKEEEEKGKKDGKLLDWKDALALDLKVGFNLTKTRGIADVNFRVAVDSYANVYILGRARSQPEMNKVINISRETSGVKKLYNYAVVRP